MKKCSISTIFWLLVGVFAVVVSGMMTPMLRAYMILLMFFWVAFFLLGLALIVLIVKKKKEGLPRLLKKFLLLTGASAVGFLPFVLLHNAVSGLFGVEEPFFFILAAIVCPLGFLVGMIGSVVLLVRQRK